VARSATGGPEQAIQSPPRRVRVHLMEIDHGGFCRDVELPEDVDRDKIRAHYRDGILWIEIPKG
jgi:HSP20 family molecular chaperone IbpA